MKWFPRDIWKYALLLILLFAIAAIAAKSIIRYVESQIASSQYTLALQSLSWSLWALTVGFMFLSGALGLWAIRSIGEVEGARRVGRFVDAMDYLSDGLLVVDKKGRITGSNPSAKRLGPHEVLSGTRLRDVFPSITAEEMRLLLDPAGPNEVEKEVVYPDGLRALRFRSEPSEGILLLVLSDVTAMRRQALRERQAARLRIVGRIGRGIANDLNNILCSILGHADLLARNVPAESGLKASVEEIVQSARRGTLMAQHVLQLGQAGHAEVPTEDLREHVEKAAHLLRAALSGAWQVEVTGGSEFPAVALSPTQIEQAVLNIGLLCADVAHRPGMLRVSLGQPGDDHLTGVDRRYPAVVVISAFSPEQSLLGAAVKWEEASASTVEDAGIVQSIVRSMLDEVGGRLDAVTMPDGQHVYRLCLPYAAAGADAVPEADLDPATRAAVARWSVLLARDPAAGPGLENRFRELGATVENVDNMVSTLARVQDEQPPSAIIVEKDLLGPEAPGLLRAIAKLCPRTGVVVLCEEPDDEKDLPNMIFESHRADPNRVIAAAVQAWRVANSRT